MYITPECWISNPIYEPKRMCLCLLRKKCINVLILKWFIDGSLSDTAVGQLHGLEVPQKEPTRKDSHRERDRDRSNQFVGLSKKSNSTSQLSATGKPFVDYP